MRENQDYGSIGDLVGYGRLVLPSLPPHLQRTFSSRNRSLSSLFLQVGKIPSFAELHCASMILNLIALLGLVLSNSWIEHARSWNFEDYSQQLSCAQSISFPSVRVCSMAIEPWTGWACFHFRHVSCVQLMHFHIASPFRYTRAHSQTSESPFEGRLSRLVSPAHWLLHISV